MARLRKYPDAPYLGNHPKGGFEYQRDVPRPFKAAVGRNRWRAYHKACSEREAKQWARALAAQHDDLIKTLLLIPPDDLMQFVADGGLEAIPRLEGRAASLARHSRLDPHTAALFSYPGRTERVVGTGNLLPPSATAADWALYKSDRAAEHDGVTQTLERLKVVALKVQPSAEFSWQGLFDNWVRKTLPRDTAQHPRTLRFLHRHIGDVDYRTVTGHQIEAFLRKLATVEGLSVAMQHKERSRVSGMYRAAKLEMGGKNPCLLASVDGVYVKVRKRPYKGAEVRAILDTAAATEFGGKRHRECLWMLRIEAFMGCRIQEASQVQKGDIRFEDGAWAIWFRGTCAVTGRTHKEKHIKTEAERRLPLHPALFDPSHPQYVGESLTDYAKGPSGEFLFAAFAWSGVHKGRAQYMITELGPFIREVCEITRPNLQPNHAFRHRWNDAAINAGWDKDQRERFLGHGSSVNRGYGDGMALRLAADRLREVDPLAAL